jgi:hypothetical protein
VECYSRLAVSISAAVTTNPLFHLADLAPGGIDTIVTS